MATALLTAELWFECWLEVMGNTVTAERSSSSSSRDKRRNSRSSGRRGGGVVGVIVKSPSSVCGRCWSNLATAAGCSDWCCSRVFLCLQLVSGYYVRKATTSIHISSHNIANTRTYQSTPYRMSRGRTVPWLRRLVAGFPPLWHGDLVVDKWHSSRLLSQYSACPLSSLHPYYMLIHSSVVDAV